MFLHVHGNREQSVIWPMEQVLNYCSCSSLIFPPHFFLLDKGTARLWRGEADRTVVELPRKGTTPNRFPLVVDVAFSPVDNTLFTVSQVGFHSISLTPQKPVF